MCAAVTSARKCVACLLELGADPNIVVNENGACKTALLCAFSYPDMEVIKMLCEVTTSGGSNTNIFFKSTLFFLSGIYEVLSKMVMELEFSRLIRTEDAPWIVKFMKR